MKYLWFIVLGVLPLSVTSQGGDEGLSQKPTDQISLKEQLDINIEQFKKVRRTDSQGSYQNAQAGLAIAAEQEMDSIIRQ